MVFNIIMEFIFNYQIITHIDDVIDVEIVDITGEKSKDG